MLASKKWSLLFLRGPFSASPIPWTFPSPFERFDRVAIQVGLSGLYFRQSDQMLAWKSFLWIWSLCLRPWREILSLSDSRRHFSRQSARYSLICESVPKIVKKAVIDFNFWCFEVNLNQDRFGKRAVFWPLAIFNERWHRWRYGLTSWKLSAAKPPPRPRKRSGDENPILWRLKIKLYLCYLCRVAGEN